MERSENLKVCFFVGHRNAPENIYTSLKKMVEKCVQEDNVTEFVVGNYGSFDRLAAQAVKEIKKQHPEIKLVKLFPYYRLEQHDFLETGYDETFYPPEMEKVPKRYAIVKANRYMIQHSDFLIAYAWEPGSNAMNFLKYAERIAAKTDLQIENLA